MFKNKTTKKRHSDSRMTLTAKDKEVRSSFKTKKSKIAKLKREKDTIKNRIKSLSPPKTPEQCAIIQSLKRKLTEIKKKIASIRDQTNLINYEIKTHRLRVEYHHKCQDQSKSKDRTKRSRADILDEYMTLVDVNYMPKESRKKILAINYECMECGAQCRIDSVRASLLCTKCGCVQSYMDSDTSTPSFKEMDQKNMSHSYGYQRSNHFCEWLSQFQAKERKDIPDDVYNKIRNEMKKAYFTEFDKLTPKRTHEFLKKLGLQSYYDHIPYIMSTINGIPPPCLDPETEIMLKKMFQLVQKPWIKIKPPTRKNFLSYSYIIHKFCELLELDHLLKYFPLLKNIDRLREQDQYWKKICAILKWEYYPSI